MRHIYLLTLLLCLIFVGICGYFHEYGTMGFAIFSCFLCFDLRSKEITKLNTESIYEEAELVFNTIQHIWEKEDLALKYAREISEWLGCRPISEIKRYIEGFTQHNITIQGEEWYVINWYPYDYTGIELLVFVKKDSSHIITIPENQAYIWSVISDNKFDNDDLKNYALKWRFM